MTLPEIAQLSLTQHFIDLKRIGLYIIADNSEFFSSLAFFSIWNIFWQLKQIKELTLRFLIYLRTFLLILKMSELLNRSAQFNPKRCLDLL